jgi:chromosome segregation ATPase
VRDQVKERESRIRELETSAGSNTQLIADLRAQVSGLQRQAEERNAEIADYERTAGRSCHGEGRQRRADQAAHC